MNTSYYPLTSGYTWQYSIQKTTAAEVSRQKEIVQNLGIEKGEFIQKSFIGTKSYLEESADGIQINRIILENGKEIPRDKYTSTVLNYPIESGVSWNDIIVSHMSNSPGSGSQKMIEAIPVLTSIAAINELVTVPAGKYYNCIRIEANGTKFVREGKYPYQPKMTISTSNTRWYAPGVGLLKEIQVDKSSIHMYPENGFTKELVDFEKRV